MIDKRTSIGVTILTIIMTFMEMTALPAALFCNIQIRDIEPIYFSLMINFIFAFALCYVCRKTIIKEWNFGLQFQNILIGLKRYGIPSLVATLIVAVAFCIGLSPFNNKPTIYRVIVEGVVYYIGVAIMEEIYLRGLLQNIIEKWFGKRDNATLYAVIISSALFGFGHIFGALGQPILTIICKAVWATALGVYFGAVYVKTRNLWIPIILHFVVDLCGIPFCFSKSNQYPTIGLVFCLIMYLLLGIYGIYIIHKNKDNFSPIYKH